MLKIILLLATLAAPVVAGNWYVAAYGDINYVDHASDSTGTSPITNFDECVAAGYPIMESYPEQCRTADGHMFTNEPSSIPGDAGSVSEPAEETSPTGAEAAAVAAVREKAAQDFGVDPDMIDLISVSKAEWPDGCLGLAGPDEMCIMMIIPGYEITLAANGDTAIYRTDQTGGIIKKESSR